MLNRIAIITGVLLLAGCVFAQYDEVWEADIYSPRETYTIGIAQAMPDSTGMHSEPSSRMR